jgi:uncharacterized protein YbjT (DUF2867 family)
MILLTGVTGKTGGATLQALLAMARSGQKIPLRAIVRTPEKAAAVKAEGVEVLVGDVTDPAVVARGLEGVEKALLIAPNGEHQFAMEKQFVDAALKAGLKHLVKMSSIEATAVAKSPIARIHYESEQYIQQSGITWTFIKPTFFMQNFLANAGTIKEQGKFFLPMGDGRVATVDCRDIGAVTAAVLAGGDHGNRRYELTGPEVLSFHDMAKCFTQVLGREISYVPMPMEAYRGVLGKFLTNEWHLNAVCALFNEIAETTDAEVTDTVKRLTGQPARSLETFIRDHKAVFTP